MTTTALLGEVCDIVIGRTPARTKPEYWAGPHPWLSIGDMGKSRIISETKEGISDRGASLFKDRRVSPGTVLLSFKLSVGKVGIAAIPLYTNEAIAALPIRDESKLVPEFLARYLEYVDLTPGTDRAAMGNTLNLPKLQAIAIPLPPLPEQRRIASILDQADALRAKRRSALALFKGTADSVFVQMFGDPVLGSAQWPVIPLGQLGESRLGKMLDAKQQTGAHAKPYLRNTNVQWFEFDLTSVLEMDILPHQRAEYAVMAGDVLICEGGQPGRAAIWRDAEREIYFQKALHRYRPDPSVLNSEYLVRALWLISKEPTFGGLVTSATIAHLTGEKLRQLAIPVPPISLQRDFAKRIEKIHASQSLHENHLVRLDELFASLQQRAFSGQL